LGKFKEKLWFILVPVVELLTRQNLYPDLLSDKTLLLKVSTHSLNTRTIYENTQSY